MQETWRRGGIRAATLFRYGGRVVAGRKQVRRGPPCPVRHLQSVPPNCSTMR
jgi:hypothetical protein